MNDALQLQKMIVDTMFPRNLLEFIELKFLNITADSFLANVKVTEDAIVVDSTNQKENLGPAKEGDSINGGDTVGDIGKFEARGNLARESVDLRNNVSKDGKHANTSVLELGSAVNVERFRIDVVSKTSGI